MYTLNAISPRVEKIREKYRTTMPRICTARYRIVTEFYKENPQLQGNLKRAENFRNIALNRSGNFHLYEGIKICRKFN